MEGKFIVFEGVDGAGTTSVSSLFNELLKHRGWLSVWTAEPGYNPIAHLIRKQLDTEVIQRVKSPDALAFLFTAARAEHVYSTINPVLEQGRHVVSDRYILSTVIYQTLQGADLEAIINANSLFPVPDFMFVLDTDPFTAWHRIKQRRSQEVFETFDFIERVAKRYHQVFDLAMELEREFRFELAKRIVVLDSNENSVEDLAMQTVNYVLDCLNEKHFTFAEVQKIKQKTDYEAL